MAYVAVKPCRFAGQEFRIGDSVPAEVVQPGAAKNLVKMGIIAPTDAVAPAPVVQKAPAAPVQPTTIDLTVTTKEGEMQLSPSVDGIKKVFAVLTGNVKDAEKTIKTIDEDDTLILLHLADARKSVKDLAEARAVEIAPSEDE